MQYDFGIKKGSVFMISVVTAYFNRKQLFVNTLKSIEKSKYKDFEVIAVDDGSREEERLEDLKFPFLRVVRIEPKDKWYFNSCIPYNRGIAQAKGDIIVLQNPECYHYDDILSYAVKNVDDSNYVAMSCYSINKDMDIKESVKRFKTLPQRSVIDYVGWYNHAVYRPVYYHFCAALTMKNLNILGGFDERFAMGVGYEDNEFIDRVSRLRLKMAIPDVSVIHQWHPKVYDLINRSHFDLYAKNGYLHKETKKELIIKAVKQVKCV
jgi:glycosyltransferase involved in cell wall biosynthesis